MPRSFVGRAPELASLTAALAGDEHLDTRLAVLIGPGGVGKTSVAVRWAIQELGRFPDGQLFLDLQGFSADRLPVAADVALRALLMGLGVAESNLPTDLGALTGLYRSLLADRELLILLDNARDAGQVVPLLPGPSACTVVVTSRSQLIGLSTHGAHRIQLRTLPDVDAEELLTVCLGTDRANAERDAVAALAKSCAGLPLALRVVAARAATNPDFPLRLLATELNDHSTRLDALDAGEIPLNVRAAFSWSRNALTPDAARVFDLLGLVPGPDIGTDAVARLAAVTPPAARPLLRELEQAHLVEQPTPGRYRMHDLLRLYAADQARANHGDDRCGTATDRLMSYYLETVRTVHRHLEPDGTPLAPLPDREAAWAWFEAERDNLHATQQLALESGRLRETVEFARVMDALHSRKGHLHDRVATCERALDAANLSGDNKVLGLAHRLFGGACGHVFRHTDAATHLRRALELSEESVDQAATHYAMATLCALQGDYQQALAHATEALDLYQRIDVPLREAALLTVVGSYLTRLGRLPEARRHCETALTMSRQRDFPQVEVGTLDSLGQIAHASGDPRTALDYYFKSLALRRQFGHKFNEANTLDRIGRSQAALGEVEEARRTWLQALEMFVEQGRWRNTERIRRQLDALPTESA